MVDEIYGITYGAMRNRSGGFQASLPAVSIGLRRPCWQMSFAD